MNGLSIIVPVLNEAAALPGLVEALAPLARQGCEVIIVDGASSDDSAGIARRARFRVIQSGRGRARQMNAGAERATGETLLFLHADTRLPDDAAALVVSALAQGTACWGRFDVRIAGRPVMLRVVAALMNLRSAMTGIATGDQALFVKRTAFDAVGGFPDQPLMEDIALSERLRELSRPARIRRKLTTSGRRWEQRGVWRTIILMWRLRWEYWCGVSPEQLAQRYR